MEEIGKRLRETTDACIKNFENWVKEGKSLETREALMESMHEVRKVVSRVEIEIAISERDRLGSRPLPIPPHRSSNKRAQGDDSDMSEDDFNASENQSQGEQQAQPRRQPQGRSGGSRRPMPNRGERSGNSGGNGGNGENQPQ